MIIPPMASRKNYKSHAGRSAYDTVNDRKEPTTWEMVLQSESSKK